MLLPQYPRLKQPIEPYSSLGRGILGRNTANPSCRTRSWNDMWAWVTLVFAFLARRRIQQDV